MSEETIADNTALKLVGAMRVTKSDARKLELKTIREVLRACRQLEAECSYYEGVRLLQGGGKSQHAKERKQR